jgi:cytosine/adenosine deaminase-related metal-dependent hydrolase
MGTTLLEHIDTLATFDDERTRLHDAWILVRDQSIAAIGSHASELPPADRRIDLTGYVVLPGLINTHHHLFQCLLRNLPPLQDVTLFPWLYTMYRLMSEVRDEDYYIASKINHAELLLSGCTTNVDHSYLKVNDMQFDSQIRAAEEIGIRFHLARGSFSIGQSKGGLPPDHIVEDEDDILADTERLIQKYHDLHPLAMVRIDNAPCSPFSVSERLMRESIAMARRYGVGSHTHLAECPEDHEYMMKTYGKRSVYVADSWGWTGPDVWYAHAVVLDEGEMDVVARTGTGVAHCPNSNAYTAAGICPVTPLLKKGATVGLGVDGSAANNSSNMLAEVRSALMLQRVKYGGKALSAAQALELAITGGARLLRRDDIGAIAPGKAADLIGVDTRKLGMAGGFFDPVAGLVFCDANHVDLSMVNGRIRVQDGELVGLDLPALVREHNQHAADLIDRTEKRYHVDLTSQVHRRAYPYQ